MCGDKPVEFEIALDKMRQYGWHKAVLLQTGAHSFADAILYNALLYQGFTLSNSRAAQRNTALHHPIMRR